RRSMRRASCRPGSPRSEVPPAARRGRRSWRRSWRRPRRRGSRAKARGRGPPARAGAPPRGRPRPAPRRGEGPWGRGDRPTTEGTEADQREQHAKRGLVGIDAILEGEVDDPAIARRDDAHADRVVEKATDVRVEASLVGNGEVVGDAIGPVETDVGNVFGVDG